MKAINKEATKVMDRLTEGLDSESMSRKIENTTAFMAVHVDWLGQPQAGDIFSVAHYYQQNGDLMRDPDMTFLKALDSYYPLSFRQDGLPIMQEAVEWEEGTIKAFRPRLQAELATFANMWLRNIKLQQGLR